MPTISTSDGVQLHYTDDGDGRPVVLIVFEDCGHAVDIDQPEQTKGHD